jgi:hypothetical protein
MQLSISKVANFPTGKKIVASAWGSPVINAINAAFVVAVAHAPVVYPERISFLSFFFAFPSIV